MDRKRQLLIQKIDRRLDQIADMDSISGPSQGWIKSLRTAMNMTLEQLGNKLGISRSAVKRMELREQAGAISINSLRQVGQALGMELFYGLRPREGNLEKHIRARARRVAEQIVRRTGTTMDLEGQPTSTQRREEEIENLTRQLMADMPKHLWN